MPQTHTHTHTNTHTPSSVSVIQLQGNATHCNLCCDAENMLQSKWRDVYTGTRPDSQRIRSGYLVNECPCLSPHYLQRGNECCCCSCRLCDVILACRPIIALSSFNTVSANIPRDCRKGFEMWAKKADWLLHLGYSTWILWELLQELAAIPAQRWQSIKLMLMCCVVKQRLMPINAGVHPMSFQFNLNFN